jgi:3',5'-cyclic AMP phosphodiesterase CpdA
VRIVQLSDTHISHLGGVASENISLLIDYINGELRPDLVINTGDVVVLNPDSAEDRQAAWRLHQRIEAPLRVLPGNHDVGEPGENPWMGISVKSDRVAGFRAAWGPDRFLELGRAATGAEKWAFIGVNSELMSSGLPEENEQWAWLTEAAAEVRGRSVMLFLHKPLWFPGGAKPGITITEADRERLVSIFAAERLRVVGNGHVHRYRNGLEGDVLTVWAPSLTFASPPDAEHGFGPSPSGVVEYRVEGDAVDAHFRAVPGLVGVEDVFSLREVALAMEELKASTSA